MAAIMMSRQDLLELYQLLECFRRTYPEKTEKTLDDWLETISDRFAERTHGEDIRNAHNPRNAGRTRRYTPEQDAQILRFYQEGMSIRKIAALANASPGHVQDVLRRHEIQTNKL